MSCSQQASVTVWKQASGQPTHPILYSRKTRMLCGATRITSSTRSSYSKDIGVSVWANGNAGLPNALCRSTNSRWGGFAISPPGYPRALETRMPIHVTATATLTAANSTIIRPRLKLVRRGARPGRHRGSRQRPFLGAGTGERPHPRLVGSEFPGRSRIDDDPVIQHIGVVGDFQAHPRILFDQQHRNALGLHLLDDAKHLAHDQRRQPLRGLVED